MKHLARVALRALAVAIAVIVAASCEDSGSSSAPQQQQNDADAAEGADASEAADPQPESCEPGAPTPVRPCANPTEYVGLTVRVPLAREDVVAFLDPLVGAAATTSNRATDLAVEPGVLISSLEDIRTNEQGILQLDIVASTDVDPGRRSMARAPFSFEYGRLFVDTVAAALAELDGDSYVPGEGERFVLELRLRSTQGGHITLRVSELGETALVELVARGPRTALSEGVVNQAAEVGEPVETIYGLVYFDLSRDDFEFFATRAYGITAGAGQNFKDFRLVPHNWLRLTVTPELDAEQVDVGFEVVLLDGRRIPISRAPASLRAGEQFMQTVFRLVDNMTAQEAALPGSSTGFAAPFYYDDPNGGGVVEVIAEGNAGKFRIAYAVESPLHPLLDVDFVPYMGKVEVPEDWDVVKTTTCEEFGSIAAPQGFFTFRFKASSTVRNSQKLTLPLRGRVWGSVYRAEDVVITGPLPGSEAVADFYIDEVDLSQTNEATWRLDTQLLAGSYQILGFMDINDNATASDPSPDPGDPVLIPIGAYPLECAEHPVNVEFALLLPE
jgi:hypothetical protein